MYTVADLHRVLRVRLPAVKEVLQVQHHLLPGTLEVCHAFPDHSQVLLSRYLVLGGETITITGRCDSHSTMYNAANRSMKIHRIAVAPRRKKKMRGTERAGGFVVPAAEI